MSRKTRYLAQIDEELNMTVYPRHWCIIHGRKDSPEQPCVDCAGIDEWNQYLRELELVEDWENFPIVHNQD